MQFLLSSIHKMLERLWYKLGNTGRRNYFNGGGGSHATKKCVLGMLEM